MDEEELKKRTKLFSLCIIKLVNALPCSSAGKIIGYQLLKSGTSTGANYRSACRSRSTAEFIAKLGIVIEEVDESAYWLELIIEGKLIKKELVESLLNEANELTAIMVASSRTTSKNNQKFKITNQKLNNSRVAQR